MIIKIIGFVVTIIMVSGCATTYDTEKSYWTGNRGFSQTQLENDIWQIDFTGNTHTNSETRKKYLLKKAAEITIKENYSFFKVIQSRASTDSTGNNATEEDSSTRARGRSKKPYIHTNTFTSMTIRLLNEKGNEQGAIYDASLIKD